MPPIIWVDSDVEDAEDLIEIVEPLSPHKKTLRALVGPSNILNTPTPRKAKKRPLPPADDDSDIEIVEPTPKMSRKQEKSKAREPSAVIDLDDDDDAAVAAALQKQWDQEDAAARKKREQADAQSTKLIARIQEMDAKMAIKRKKLKEGKVPEDGIIFHVAIDAEGNTIEGDHDPDNAAHLEEVKRDFEQGTGMKVKNGQFNPNSSPLVREAKLEARFEAAKELLKSRGVDVTERNLFHGTAAANIKPILEGGFFIPGVTPGARMSNGAACGVGVYLAEQSSTSMAYAQGGTRMFMCRVITGRSTPLRSQDRPPPLTQSQFESWSQGPGTGVFVVKYVDLVVPRYVVEFKSPIDPYGMGGVMGPGVAGWGVPAAAAGLGIMGGAGLGVAGAGGAGLGVAAGGAGIAAIYARMAAFALPPPIPVAPPIPVFNPLTDSPKRSRAKKPASKRTPAVKTEIKGKCFSPARQDAYN
ncbi:hypothetical protein FB45DRAFT_1125802 [Roridomyces roridus]|uniref:PARP catalytic domain-containing protein n=1 Tax=Roridomyces roridus TaxID=1738132 RepID=A0AAD7FWJ7_9AGAR|nr:hypothetical protein FB45DRAFT_1125802 [Roridomyces roridus]